MSDTLDDATERWLRCALHAHTTRSDGELAPRDLARHYARAGYDVLAITDHWRITADDSVDGIIVLPSVELNCILPGARDGHVLGYGVSPTRTSCTRSRSEHADLAEVGGLDRRARRRPVPRASVLDGGDAGNARAAGRRRRDRGLQRRLRARDRSRPLGRALGRAARGRAPVPGARHRRLAPPGLRLRPRVDVGARRASARGRRCSRRCAAGEFYGSTGPRIDEISVADGAVEVRCSPCRSVTLVSGRSTGAAVNAGRLGYRHRGRDPRVRRGELVRPRSARGARRRARHVRVEVTDARGTEGMGEPDSGLSRGDALDRARGAQLRPARHRRRDRRRRDRRARGAGRARGRTRRRRRLRRGDVERVVEAHPRRAPLPAPRRRAARARGAPRAARAVTRSSRRTSSTACRSCFRCTRTARSGRRSCRAGSSSTRPLARSRLQLARRRRPRGARARAAAPARGAALVRALRGRVDERRAALPRERPRGGGRRRDRAERRRGRRAPLDTRAASRAPRSASTESTSRSTRASWSTPPGRGSTTSAGSRIRLRARRCG